MKAHYAADPDWIHRRKKQGARKKVTMLPATISCFTPSDKRGQETQAAGYARVSTDRKEQLTSYEAQVDYNTKYAERVLSPDISELTFPRFVRTTRIRF